MPAQAGLRREAAAAAVAQHEGLAQAERGVADDAAPLGGEAGRGTARAEGAVMLANHTARALLAPCAFSAGGAAACFATQWCGIVGYAALGLRQPFVLRDRRGGGFSAQASLRRHTS